MKKAQNIILLFLLFSICSCSEKASDDKKTFKNAIELSIYSTTTKLDPVFKEAIILFKKGIPDDNLVNMYNEGKSHIKMQKKLVEQLEEVDTEINLKAQALTYLDNNDKLLDGFLLPTIKYLNESKPIDQQKLNETLTLFQQNVNHASLLNESLKKFCDKYNLPKIRDDFDNEFYIKKAEKLKDKN